MKKIDSKSRFKSWLKRKVSFRTHMSLLMFSLVVLGMLTNLGLSKMGVLHPALRYPLTLIISYGYFLLSIRFYIRNIVLRKNSSAEELNADILDFIPNETSSPIGSDYHFSGQGGSFSGGGASGSFGDASTTSPGSSSFGGFDLDLDEGAIVVIALGAIFMTVVFGTGMYFVWQAPEILSECILQLLLVSGLKKGIRKFSEAEWLSHIFKATIWSFLLVLFLSYIFGGVLKSKCPEANNLK